MGSMPFLYNKNAKISELVHTTACSKSYTMDEIFVHQYFYVHNTTT